MQFIAAFYRNHGLLQLRGRPIWRVVSGGSRVYVDALARDFRHRVRLREPIQAVRRRERCVEVFPRGGGVHRFDHVIFACHSDQALAMLGSEATLAERSVLSAFPYVANRAVLHTDVALLPRARRAWASWNYLLSEDEGSPAMVTYLMNRLQGLLARNTYCVTLNPRAPIDAARILGEFIYHHPVFDARRATAQARHAELLTAQTSFCGAYWGNGFHEDGVVSGLAVVASIRALEQSHSTSRAWHHAPWRRAEFCVGAAV
jgi:predicted NAD/FAD-binding protein